MTASIDPTSRAETRSVWLLLFGMIDKPAQSFKAILARRQRWVWVPPLLLVILATAALMYVQMPYTLELAREQMERQFASMPAEQVETIRDRMESSLTPTTMLTRGLGFGAVALLIGVLAQAVFLYLTALVVGGNDIDFGSVFTMSAWTRLPAAFGALTQAGFIAAMGRNISHAGLSFLVAGDDLMQNARDPLYLALSRIDLFWLWHLLLVAVGLVVVARFGKGKAWLLTLLYAALVLGITIVPSFLVGQFMGGA
jgi:hypothetical protein